MEINRDSFRMMDLTGLLICYIGTTLQDLDLDIILFGNNLRS